MYTARDLLFQTEGSSVCNFLQLHLQFLPWPSHRDSNRCPCIDYVKQDSCLAEAKTRVGCGLSEVADGRQELWDEQTYAENES